MSKHGKWRWFDWLGLALLIVGGAVWLAGPIWPDSCAVRGSWAGVYYLPDDPYFDLTRYRCFSSVDEAEAAGFRRGT